MDLNNLDKRKKICLNFSLNQFDFVLVLSFNKFKWYKINFVYDYFFSIKINFIYNQKKNKLI